MFTKSVLFYFLALGWVSYAQGQTFAFEKLRPEDAFVLGDIPDGSPSVRVPPRVLPPFKVMRQAEHPVREGKLTVQWVSPPEWPPEPPPAALPKISPEEEAELAKLPPEIFLQFSATVYDHQLTLLRWYHETKEYQAWSNVDFNELSIGGFQVKGQRYSLFMGLDNSFPGDESEEAAKKVLPLLRGEKPRFVLISGDPNNAEAMTPIIAVHELYANEGTRLKQAYLKREKAREEYEKWRAALPLIELHTVVQFWHGQGSAPSVNQVPPVIDSSYLLDDPPMRAAKQAEDEQARAEQRAVWAAKIKRPAKPPRI